MNYPYANFYLEAQRAKRNLLHVFEAEPDLTVADPVLLAAKCAPAQARKKKADSRLNLSELFLHSRELLTRLPTRGAPPPRNARRLCFIRGYCFPGYGSRH